MIKGIGINLQVTMYCTEGNKYKNKSQKIETIIRRYWKNKVPIFLMCNVQNSYASNTRIAYNTKTIQYRKNTIIKCTLECLRKGKSKQVRFLLGFKESSRCALAQSQRKHIPKSGASHTEGSVTHSSVSGERSWKKMGIGGAKWGVGEQGCKRLET